MAVMIKLRLRSHPDTLDAVQSLPGLQDLTLDPRFGVVGINPKEGLYVVRTESVTNLEERRRLSPEILEAYGDVRISTT
ncbi:MAG TPA: hypothetical protein VHK01_18985 [Lacipirellulaceae bacterium]|jgi:hypothetical protein|nr:hypothetical protein [Lacipirellulaceae bacterium]